MIEQTIKVSKGNPLPGLKSLFLSKVGSLHENIYWELIDLPRHLPILFSWIQQPYAKTYWQMDHLSYGEYQAHYAAIEKGDKATSLIGYYQGEIICQVEVYTCLLDEIAVHYEAKNGDIGIHFLMAPVDKLPVKELSLRLMQSILKLLLSLPDVDRVMGEPDHRNGKANELVVKAGFQFIRTIRLSYKTANLYQCTGKTLIQ